ncbi:MAG: hypothetical protein J2O44_04380 [Porphyrobacter sp.]|nr:hypothetical protein [Porphyrobacter sp.]
MSRSILAAAAAVVAMLAPQAPALAQRGGIVIIAPRAPNRDEPKYNVHPSTRIFSQSFVPTGDLNLRTGYGRYVLDRRMRLAADAACNRLDLIEPSSGVGSELNPDKQDCRFRAYKLAQEQARYMIWRAG